MEKEKLAAKALWNTSPAGTSHAKGLTQSSQKLFEKVRTQRNTYEIPSVLQQIPFHTFKKKKVLEIGAGQGFDAYEFCKQDCDYTGIDLAPNNIERARKNLDALGLKGKFVEADAENLPFTDQSFDVAFSNGVLHHTPNLQKSFQETYRVLKKGGEFWVTLYHKNSIFYWLNLFFYYQICKRGFLKHTMKQRLSMIEYSAEKAPSNVLVNVYKKKSVKKYLEDTGFDVSGIWIRKLNPEDFPGFPVLNKLWPRLSPSLLKKLEKRWGWYIIAHGKKMLT